MIVKSIGRARFVQANFTRPNDTNAYAAGDVIADSTSAATIITLEGAVKGDGESSIILTAKLISSANQATKLDARLWLFDTAPSSYGNDNAAFTPTDAEMRTVLAVIAFPSTAWIGGDATSGAGGNAMCEAQGLWLPIATAARATGNSIYAVLEARNAYTPVAQERFDLRLGLVD